MKKALLLVLISFNAFISFSQEGLNKKKPTLAINFIMNDYRTAGLLKSSSLGGILNEGSWSNLSEMQPGLAVSYYQGLTNNVDFMATLGGSFVDYATKTRPRSGSEKFLVEADANLNMKLLSDHYVVTPYFSAGVGASKYGVHWGAYIPFGVGLQFKLSEESFLFTNFQYRVGITDNSANHFNYSIGFGAPLFGSGK
jgi:hypothetical protein